MGKVEEEIRIEILEQVMRVKVVSVDQFQFSWCHSDRVAICAESELLFVFVYRFPKKRLIAARPFPERAMNSWGLYC